MQSIQVNVRRICIISSRPFGEVVQRITDPIGHPNMATFHDGIVAAQNASDMEKFVGGAVSTNDLMEFYRFDSGLVLSKIHSEKRPGLLRILIGNPVIMAGMANTASQAASYAPITVLVQEVADEVCMYYDTMESLLEPYGSQTALDVARDLDNKVIELLEAAAQ